MDFDEFDDSLALDDNHHHILPRRSSQPRSFSDEPEQNSSDSHDHYHALHFESIERATAAEEEEPVFGAPRARSTKPLVSTTHFKQAISEMKERILVLERQLASASSNEGHAGFIGKISATDPTRDVKVMFENSVKDGFDQQQMIPHLYDRSWSDFMNKHAGEKYEYAIEVLVGEPEYHHPTKDTERIDRRQGNNRSLRPESEICTDLISSRRGHEALPIPERIRINSQWILNILAGIDKHVDATGPVVMLRPFKFLVHYETQIKDSIRMLENQLNGPKTTMSPDQFAESLTSEPSSKTYEVSTVSRDIENRQLTLQHMRCLTEFIDQYIKPTVVRLANNSDGKIQFRDLWYIFRPGENIYMPLRLPQGPVSLDAVMTTPELFQSRYNMLWRVAGAGGGRPNLFVAQSRNSSLKPNPFKVNCYYIDFDGKYFCPTTHTFSIMPFKGERDITSLDFFPVRFLKAAQHTIKEHFDKGKMIFDNIAASFAHYYYAGPTLVVQPCGCPLQNDPLHQEHVESEVIVDFRMTLIKNPSWRPKPVLWKAPPVERRELQERYPVRYWNDRGRAKLENTEHDHIYDDYFIDKERATTFRKNEQIFAPIPSGWLSNESMVPEKDVLLLPGRVFAFVLRTRTFAPLWLWRLQPIKPQIEGLHNLQLRDDTFKDTVQALVRTHFIQKNAPQTSDFEYDVVRGKGKGLVILLHGAPGVGKTFTAESVAAANGKPLFQMTCGDLGLTPGEVEKALKEIFRFAQLWSCVLLLDECDIFLAQRSKNDIKRNSLVSVFLRVLEFYTGVLFLTTNRVGVLDDAIKSRITWIAYYPPLDEQQTKKIWKVQIKLLEERNKRLQVDRKGILRFAKEHFRSSVAKDSTWNGRQIQNAFKVATALAEWDAYSKDVRHNIDTRVPEEDMPSQPRLLVSHFNTIAAGTQAFDSYLQEATGYTDAERAFNAMERADDYTTEDNAHDGGSITVPQDSDRNQLPSISSPSSSFPSQRRSPSTTLASPHSYGREPSPVQHLQTARRRTSNQHQHQPSLSSSGYNLNNLPPPQSQSRRSSNQLTAIAGSMDPQLQSPRSRRSSYNASHSHTNAAAAAATTSPPPPSSSSLRAKKHGGHLSSSNSTLVRQDSDYDDDNGVGNGFGSSEDEDGNGYELGGAVSDGEDDGEEW